VEHQELGSPWYVQADYILTGAVFVVDVAAAAAAAAAGEMYFPEHFHFRSF
jgi:hypothetical protein